MKGNVAIARAAIEAGCRFYFGYPITPQNDIPEYLALHLPLVGGTFLQAESEIASINMCLGVAATGGRAMTSSSGPGLSLKQEGLSYMASSQLPVVVVNIMRSGPGLGGISPSQGDYFQATRGGGHGDYRMIVLAPNSSQEMWDLTILAFHLTDKYRNPAQILADAVLGQTSEAIEIRRPTFDELPPKEYIVSGAKGRPKRVIKSLFLGEGELEAHNWRLYEKYKCIQANEVRYEEYLTEDADMVVVAFGICSRISRAAIDLARKKGIRVGLFRPITLWPFPMKQLRDLSNRVHKLLSVELNTGQMVEDIRISVGDQAQIFFYGRPPGAGSLPYPEDVLAQIEKYAGD